MNTPVGVLRAIVILPSCLDFTVAHRLLRQTSTCLDHGHEELYDEHCAWIMELNEAAGAADASRAMLRMSCPSVTHRIAVLTPAHFLSTAKPTAYR
jgi:hypothetical protein